MRYARPFVYVVSITAQNNVIGDKSEPATGKPRKGVMLNEAPGIENQVIIRNAPSPVIRQRGRFYDAAGRDAFPKNN